MDTTFIAIVEDDREIGALLEDLLRREGFEAAWVRTGQAFDQLQARRRIDLALLDIMLPGEDGLSICRRLRARGEVPVLLVSAKSDDVDRIVGLEIGADDYVAKPFNPRELLARIRAVLRRTREAHRATAVPPTERLSFAGLELDVGRRSVESEGGHPVALSSGEFDLLLCFARHPQRVLSRDQLLDWTRGRSSSPFDRSVDVQVGRLRRRLAAAGAGEALIKTVRGGGYLFAAEVVRQ